ncbi:ATP-dependent helicase [Candidatus Poriferisocius sp.]|uniref:ATP-dependent helicase n=1 Tax=Candidatus Poriferisocius sp. TaxID=3101276 RepID=UPI003B5B3BC5
MTLADEISGGLMDGLNERQQAAVVAPGTPLCIRAGAGTGKTRVLTRRIAHQAAIDAIDPERTLALTFTRKAADEMHHRLATLGLRGKVRAGTFHRAAFAQLRTRWAERNVRPPELLQDKRGLLARVANQAGVRLGRVERQEAVAEIEWAKARRISPNGYLETAPRLGRQTALPPDRIAELYRRYEQEKVKRRVVDFDDLLSLALRDLTDDPEYAEACRWRFPHVFVDEFQDVNPLQFDLLRAWLGERNDLCAVGDPNQAIYGWNGADADYIERFGHWFPGATVLELVDNYRSTPQILAAGRAVLPPGAAALVAHQLDGPRPKVHTHATDADEAVAVARALRDAKGPETAWSSMAVLARTNAQTATLATALRRAMIPFRVRAEARRGDHDAKDPPATTGDAVDVATFHAAKGLEWPIVHLVGLEQGLVPISRAQTPAEIAEERRLLYVAITRAQQELHCHWAGERAFGDRTSPRSPSPYLNAIVNAATHYKGAGRAPARR